MRAQCMLGAKAMRSELRVLDSVTGCSYGGYEHPARP